MVAVNPLVVLTGRVPEHVTRLQLVCTELPAIDVEQLSAASVGCQAKLTRLYTSNGTVLVVPAEGGSERNEPGINSETTCIALTRDGNQEPKALARLSMADCMGE